MASTILTPIEHGPDWGQITPFFTVTLADQTATTATQNASAPCRYFSAYISLKTFVTGAAPVFKLVVSAASGFTNPIVIAQTTGDNTATATETQTFILQGVALVAAVQYIQVQITFNTSGVYDCIIDAVQ